MRDHEIAELSSDDATSVHLALTLFQRGMMGTSFIVYIYIGIYCTHIDKASPVE